MPSLSDAKVEMGLYVAKTFGLRALAMTVGLVVLIQSLDLVGQSNNILAVPGANEAALWAYVKWRLPILTSNRKSTRLNSSHGGISRMPSSA